MTDEDNIPGTKGSGTGVRRTIRFNASRSNILYGASNTVQPPAISLLPQIRY